LARAGEMAKQLGKPIRLWMSDKQDAFVKGIAAEFSGIPHLYCGNHFLRDLAKPTLASDSHAKVQMRKKVRGLRGIEREVLQQRQQACTATTLPPPPDPTTSRQISAVAEESSEVMPAAELEMMRSLTDEVEDTGEASKTDQNGPGAERRGRGRHGGRRCRRGQRDPGGGRYPGRPRSRDSSRTGQRGGAGLLRSGARHPQR